MQGPPHSRDDVGLGDVVLAEDPLAHADAVVPRGRPVELLHAAVADERRVERGKVVARADDGHAVDLLLVVDARHLGEREEEGVMGGVESIKSLLALMISTQRACSVSYKTGM